MQIGNLQTFAGFLFAEGSIACNSRLADARLGRRPPLAVPACAGTSLRSSILDATQTVVSLPLPRKNLPLAGSFFAEGEN
ncbi:hypothetical protein HY622_00425 [Candidatus Uhrbacteria bacterium]|nr:hypothetical protein [Candidatus Uhrbacteria bacterium]